MKVSDMTKEELDAAMQAAVDVGEARSLSDLENNVAILELGAYALKESLDRLEKAIDSHSEI